MRLRLPISLLAAAASLTLLPQPACRADDPLPAASAHLPPPVYSRPAPVAPLFATDTLPLTPPDRTALLMDLTFLARNFPGDPAVSPALRARALAVALTLSPDYRPAVVANGQLARGVWPAPARGSAVLADIAARLHLRAAGLARNADASPLALAACLTEIARTITPALSWPDGLRPADWKQAFTPPARASAAAPPAAVAPAPAPAPPGTPIPTPAAALPLTTDNVGILLMPGNLPFPRESGRRSTGPRMVVLTSLASRLPEPQKPFTLQAWGVKVPAPLLAFSRTRFPTPDGWQIDIPGPFPSGERSLPAADMASLCLLEGHLSGKPANPRALVAVSWKDDRSLSPVLTLPDVLAYSADPPPAMVIVSAEEVEMGDWLLRNPDKRTALARFPVIRARTPGDVIALTRREPARAIVQGMQAWQSATTLLTSGSASLSDPRVLAALEECTLWTPMNLCAVWLQRMAHGGLPARLSRAGTLDRLDSDGEAVRSTDRGRYPYVRRGTKLEPTPFAAAWKMLRDGRAIDHEEASRYRDALLELARAMDRRTTSPPADATALARSEEDLLTARTRMDKARAAFLRAVQLEKIRNP